MAGFVSRLVACLVVVVAILQLTHLILLNKLESRKLAEIQHHSPIYYESPSLVVIDSNSNTNGDQEGGIKSRGVGGGGGNSNQVTVTRQLHHQHRRIIDNVINGRQRRSQQRRDQDKYQLKEAQDTTGEFNIIYNIKRQQQKTVTQQNQQTNPTHHGFFSTSGLLTAAVAVVARNAVPSVKAASAAGAGRRVDYSSTVNDEDNNKNYNNNNNNNYEMNNIDPESDVTLITTSDFLHMKHYLIPLIERWKGHISLSLYVENIIQLNNTIEFIKHASLCHSLIKQYVNFHLIYPNVIKLVNSFNITARIINEIIIEQQKGTASESDDIAILCQNFYRTTFSSSSPQTELSKSTTVEQQLPTSLSPDDDDNGFIFQSSAHNKKFPINLLRNIARSTIRTKYSFVIDINMLPSNLLRTKFHKFIKSKSLSYHHKQFNTDQTGTGDDVDDDNNGNFEDNEPKTVYVVPAFETKNGEAPESKSQLLTLLESYQARPYYFDLCWKCQVHTDYESWQRESTSLTNELSVVFEVLWKDPWEPFFISNDEQVPFYDERFQNKAGFSRLSQLCELHMNGYKFAILNDAFLIHPYFKNKESYHFDQRNQDDFEINVQHFNQFKLDMKNKYPESGRTCY